MRTLKLTLSTALVTVLLGSPAIAQGIARTPNETFERTAETLKGKTNDASRNVVGYAITPGLIFTPSFYSELGNDSNPDEAPNGEGSGFTRSGASFSLTRIAEKFLADLTASGSFMKLFNGDIRDDRWEGQVAANAVYTVAPGLSIAAGGVLGQDEIELIKERIAGAFAEVNYSNDHVTAFVRGRYIDVDYLNTTPAPFGTPLALVPLFDTANFEAERQQLHGGLLIGNKRAVALYGEASAARIDYDNQLLESVIDRDADDYYAKTGLRLTLSPYLQTDLGWRWNRRELQASGFEYESDYFDAAVRWTPSQYFSLTATIDRTIEEPSGAFATLADVKSYALKMSWRATNRHGLAFSAAQDTIREVGDNLLYRRAKLAGEATYDMSETLQVYLTGHYEKVEEDRNDVEYDQLRVSLGVRMVLGEGVDRFAYGTADDLPTHYFLPYGSKVEVSKSYAWLDLPQTRMTTVVGGAFFDEAQGQLVDHDGQVEGWKGQIRLKDVAEYDFENGRWLSFSAGAFYGQYVGEQVTRCEFTLTTDCLYTNIVDFDPDNENNTGPFGVFLTNAEREVHHWGVSGEVRFGHWSAGSLKDDAGYRDLSPVKLGVAVRGLSQDFRLHALDLSVPDPVDYREDLDTDYYGAYIGFEREFALRDDLTLSIDASAGAYYAHTDYEGRYVAYIPIGGNNYILERGAVDLAEEKAAYIANLRLDLKHSTSMGDFGVFGEVEYLSYVPNVLLNNDDQAGGTPFGVVGSQVGTSLGSEDALGYALGASLSIPLHRDAGYDTSK